MAGQEEDKKTALVSSKKIRKRYAILVLIAIVLSVTVIGALSNFAIWSKTNRDVVTIMNVTTQSEAAALDLVLLEIRDAVDTVSAYAGARVASSDLEADRGSLDENSKDESSVADPGTDRSSLDEDHLEEEIQELFLSSVEHVDGVVGYSIRFAKPYDSLVDGFTFQRSSVHEPYYPAEEEMSDKDAAEEASESDAADETGTDDWFEQAAAAGHPIWIPIRECPYTDGYILSYAVPFYFDDELVGAACVDVDFEELAKPVRDIFIFENGYGYLTDDKGTVYYHPLIGYGVLLTEDEDDVPEVDAALADTSNHGKLIIYKYQGQKKRMAFQSLINGMRLVVTANEEDVMKETLELTRNIVIAAIVIILIFVFLALKLEKWTMHPVIDRMDSLAHLDGLTGLLNRTSFLEIQEYLNGKIQAGEAVFGVVMFDANNLKKINDEHGHKMGDVYLLSVVEMIQDCFPGCQAYRIGGDEFVVLAEGEEAVALAPEQLEAAYRWQTRRGEEKREPWEKTSAAGAFVRFDPKTHHTFAEVLSEVDQRMYQKKQEMKK